MNVLYLCPDGGRDCGSLFAAPGGTSIKCRHHPEAIYQQAEDFGGADFLYVDEDGHTKSHGHVVTAGVQSTPTQSFHDAPPPAATVPEEQILIDLRTEYMHVSGRRADMRWKVQRLRDEIVWEQEQGMHAQVAPVPQPPSTPEPESPAASTTITPEDTPVVDAGDPSDYTNPEETPDGI